MTLIDTLRKFILLSDSRLRVSEIAAGAGISRETIYKILDGRVPNPAPKTVCGLAEYFGTRFEEEGEWDMLTDYDVYEVDYMHAPREDMTAEEREAIYAEFCLTEDDLAARVKELRADDRIIIKTERVLLGEVGRYREAILEATTSAIDKLERGLSATVDDGQSYVVSKPVVDRLTAIGQRLKALSPN